MPPFDQGDLEGIRLRIVGINEAGLVPERDVTRILLRFMQIVSRENNVVFVSSPITICGDIHGQLDDLLYLFQVSQAIKGNADSSFDGTKSFLFCGDYVDRGYHGLNTFLYLATLKIQFPDRIFLLRGNHESRQISMTYGFYGEVFANYGSAALFHLVCDSFDHLPVAALVDRDIFCVHGGLSPKLPFLESLSLIDRKCELPEESSIADLLWSDPGNVNEWHASSRGAGYTFGKVQTQKFTRVNRLLYVARSHQVCQQGFQKYFAKKESNDGWVPGLDFRLITVWSAPNYCYKSGNRASVLKVRDGGEEATALLFDANPNRIKPRDTEIPSSSGYFA
jgi:diadenosine tetraphosphatase ApaH/serine/threonine PP2A family protein phosphatase